MLEQLLLGEHNDNDEFVSYFLSPYLEYLAGNGIYDVRTEDLTGKVFLFQLGGPLSLSVLEKATSESLRDIRFIWHRTARIFGSDLPVEGTEVRIFRLGVAGTLAYEVHGRAEDAEQVYKALMEAGQEFSIVQPRKWLFYEVLNETAE
ncbi:hypothetical protein [Pantoea sp. USHLN256]|uniref:hypothetical protein n=1 Tax=Pantoea sp. USHLN256 TaxID=3081293 RepID=UPI003FA798A0